MANPFGGTITGKNNSHPNAADLLYAYIPRSTSNVREIINDIGATLGGAAVGGYDADGYLYGSSSSSMTNINATVSGLLNSSAFTIIVGARYIGGSPTSNDPYIGIVRAADSNVFSYGWGGDGYQNRMRARVTDGAGRDFLTNFVTPSNTYFASYVTSTGSSQSGRYYDHSNSDFGGLGASTAYTGGTQGTMTGGNMDTLTVTVNSAVGFQYMFIYGVSLGQSACETIMKNPGDVLAQSGGGGGGGGPLTIATLVRPVFGF
jgi:hypothetical protein